MELHWQCENMSKHEAIELIEWFVAGFVVAVFSTIPIPSVPGSTIAGLLFGLFLGVIFPLYGIMQEAQDFLRHSWLGGLAYAVGLLYACNSLSSSGASLGSLAWAIFEGIVCIIASFFALLKKLV
jgi:1,4-dihydroxy-2-naphthoate octaprenyltransferase